MKKKTALLLTTGYLNLHQPIITELENQGWEVTVIRDNLLEGDPKLRSTPLRNFAKRFIRFPKHLTWEKRAGQYWETILPKLADHYNLFICLNSFTIPQTVIKTIKERTDRTVLYVWDCCAVWDFSIVAPYFDAAYTFDLCDSMQHSELKLLPNYFVATPHETSEKGKFSAIMIGANRNNRIDFLSTLGKELERHGKRNYLFKLIPHPIPPLSQRLFSDYNLSKLLNAGKLEQLELKKPLSYQEYMTFMEQSEIIVDDNMAAQSGLTPRFIWALALNKKIITTNRFALRYNFVSQENVLIVDRKAPVIPMEFLTSEPVANPPSLQALEISNWVRIITGDTPLPRFVR